MLYYYTTSVWIFIIYVDRTKNIALYSITFTSRLEWIKFFTVACK